MATFHELAQQLLEQGRCVFPPLEDGSKRPAGRWKEYQKRLTSKEELTSWYSNGRTSIGLIGGAVSGNLEMFEFEGRAVQDGTKDAYLDAARQLGLLPLLERISRGWSDRSPSGGIHLYYLVSAPVTETTELASRPASAEELAVKPDDKQKLLIETRGEGGYMIIAPSYGRVHPDGPYERLHGGPDSIATISAEEREELFQLARSFDRMPVEEAGPQPSQHEGEGLRPGDDFNRRADWAGILKPHNWEYLFTASDGNQYWRRPGRDPRRRGWSATINQHGEGVLYVHSSNTEFTARRAYGKFAAYAILNHASNWSAAAAELAKQGYGERRGESRQSDQGQAPGPEQGQAPGPEQPRAEVPWQTAAEIAADTPAEVDWIWQHYLAAGTVVTLDAKLKAGKSTFLGYLMHALLNGQPFLGRETWSSPIVYLTEEGSRTFRSLLDRADLLERTDLHVLSKRKVPSLSWEELVAAAKRKLEETGAAVLVVDTLGKLAGFKDDDENSAGKAMEAMAPVQAIAQQLGIVVILVRHDRKSGGEIGDSARGSSAFGGDADVILHLSRVGGQGRERRRFLHGLGRFDETPAELVIELTEDGYQEVSANDARDKAAAALLELELPDSEEEAVRVVELLPDLTENGHSSRTVYAAIRWLVNQPEASLRETMKPNRNTKGGRPVKAIWRGFPQWGT